MKIEEIKKIILKKDCIASERIEDLCRALETRDLEALAEYDLNDVAVNCFATVALGTFLKVASEALKTYQKAAFPIWKTYAEAVAFPLKVKSHRKGRLNWEVYRKAMLPVEKDYRKALVPIFLSLAFEAKSWK